MKNESSKLRVLNQIYPEVVRYSGVAIALHEGFIAHSDRPSIYMLSIGMILYKNVKRVVENGGD